MHDHDPQPWQCDDCGRSNPWHVTMCQCEFWYPAEPAPDLSHWLTVPIQDQEEESRENHTVRFWREFADLLTEQPAARRFYEQEG